MKTLTVSGCSDDLIETEGLPGCNEFNVCKEGPYIATLQVDAGGVSIAIHCIYAGHWCFAVGPLDGYGDAYGDAMPAWPIRRTFGDVCAYSETLEIDCPDDATLVLTYPTCDDDGY
jgi:hypothetical protein